MKSDSLYCLPDGTEDERWLADYGSGERMKAKNLRDPALATLLEDGAIVMRDTNSNARCGDSTTGIFS